MSEPVAYLNGKWIPPSAAAISVSDVGFVLGASVSEQLRTFAGKLFRLEEHLARLKRSLEIIELTPPLSLEEIGRLATELTAQNYALLEEGDDLRLSIILTPGEHPVFSDRRQSQPTICLHTHPLAFHLWAEKYEEGQVLLSTEVRQVPGACWPAELKCRSRMHYYLADRRAAAADPRARALLLDEQGFVTEASTANIVIYNKAEGLVSPPRSKILHGISLATVMELAAHLGLPTTERDLTVEEVAAAEEVLLTGTSICILPVVRFNGRPIGTGRPGEVFARLLAAWSDMVQVDIAAQARRFARRRLSMSR